MMRTDIDEPTFLDSIERTVTGIRATGVVTGTLRIEFPVWMRDPLRSNIAQRAGIPVDTVTLADLELHFDAIGVEPDWDYESTEPEMI